MKNSFENFVEKYALHYSHIVPELGAKFSQPISNEIDIRARISASYELNVRRYGGHFVSDEMTLAGIDAVTSWVQDNIHRWLILYGSLGNGKTTMLHALKTVFRPACFISAQKIFDYYKAFETLPEIPDAALLLIDDLGIEPVQCKIYGEDRNPLTELLLHRYSSRATTVIATNLAIEDIQARYGDRIADKMAEIATAILYDAPSYRGR